MYYRGAVEDNNVLYAGKCWKILRTTDTGGVKLLYNGEYSHNKSKLTASNYGTPLTNTGNFEFNSTDNNWETSIETAIASSSAKEISFHVPEGDSYTISVFGTIGSTGNIHFSVYKNGDDWATIYYTNGDREYTFTEYFGSLTASDTIKVTYYGEGDSNSPTSLKVMMRTVDESLEMGCDNMGDDTHIEVSDENYFPFATIDEDYTSPAYLGYMYGDVYDWTNAGTVNGAYYGTGFTYNNGLYTLTNAKVGIDTTHHYSCNLANSNGTCASIRYYYYSGTYNSTNYNMYITLTNGESIEDAFEKMKVNTTDSYAKTIIDSWYANNLTSYTNQLEDTVWCNDRDFYDLAGFNPNGGSYSSTSLGSPYHRAISGEINLSCTNKNDSFTVNIGKGNGKLTYPTSLLSLDELVLAGGGNTDSYLTTRTNWWSLSPSGFSIYSANMYSQYYPGSLRAMSTRSYAGLRPAISLKPGTPVVNGSGTVIDPYVIE